LSVSEGGRRYSVLPPVYHVSPAQDRRARNILGVQLGLEWTMTGQKVLCSASRGDLFHPAIPTLDPEFKGMAVADVASDYPPPNWRVIRTLD